MIMIPLAPDTAIDRFLDSMAECLTPTVAQRILDIGLDPAMDSRLDELREKANAGTLSDDERAEYAGLVESLDLVALIKLKARLVLARESA